MDVQQVGARHVAAIVMRPGRALRLSAVEKAVAVADADMGKMMGAHYVVDPALPLAPVHLFLTKTAPDTTALVEALGKLPGFRTVWAAKGGFGVAFDGSALPEGKRLPTAAEVRAAAGVPVVDLLLAPSRDGARYTCPMHPETASATPGTCPTCGHTLDKAAATKPSAEAGAAEAGSTESPTAAGYTCPMCGGAFEKPGDCPKCGMALKPAGTKAKPKAGG